MSGFGSQRWGIGFFGIEEQVHETQSNYVPPLAPLFDIGTRSFPINPDGTLKGVHPIDQMMALALGIINGTIKGVVSQGTKYNSLSRLADVQLQPAAEKIVFGQKIVANLVRNSDVTILNVKTFVLAPGNNQVGVDYINNRTKRREFTNG